MTRVATRATTKPTLSPTGHRATPRDPTSTAVRRAAYALAVTAAAASLAGLAVPDVYREAGVVAAALRGGDLVTATVVAPALMLAAWFVGQGRRWAHPVMLGLLGYLLYAYAYYVFTATFGPLFLAHVVVFVGAGITLGAGLLARVEAAPLRSSVRLGVGAWLLLIAVALAWAFGSATVRFALGGPLPTDVLPFPEWRVHLGYALDLSVTVPSALVAGLGLLRRSSWSWTVATTVCVWLAAYQLNYLAAHLFVAEAGVASVRVTDPIPYVTVVVFLVPVVALLQRTATASGAEP